MSIYTDPFGDLIDINDVILTGLIDGILIGYNETIETATLDTTLLYSYPTLSVNPNLYLTTLTITDLLDSTGSIHTTQDLQGNTINSLSGNYTANASDSLILSTQRGPRLSLQTPSNTTTITEIGDGTQTINRLLMDSSTTGISSWEISDTRSLTHRGVISYDHSSDIWYIKSVNSTEVMRLEPTQIYISQNLKPNGTVNIGTSLSRFNEGHFSGSLNAGNSNFAGLNTTGDILPTTSFTRDVGNVSYKFKDFHGEKIYLYNNVLSGTTLTNKLNINGPTWANSLNYGISIGCPYSSTAPYNTAFESVINQVSTTGGLFSTNIGIIERNTAGATLNDWSRNLVINQGRLGVNMPANTLNTYTLETYARDTNIMRIFDTSSNPTMTLSKSGTNTTLSIAGTLVGGNNAYIDLCANAFGTVTARLQAYNTSTTTAGLLRFGIQNGSGSLVNGYDMDFVKFAPSGSALTQDLGSTALIWRTSYINNLYGTASILNLGYNNATRAVITGSTLRPVTTGNLDLGTSSIPWGLIYTNSALRSTASTLSLGVSSSNVITLSSSSLYPIGATVDLGSAANRWRNIHVQSIYGTATFLYIGLNSVDALQLKNSGGDVSFTPVTSGAYALGSSTLPWGVISTNSSVRSTSILSLGASSIDVLSLTASALYPLTTATTDIGTSVLKYKDVYATSFNTGSLDAGAIVNFDSTTTKGMIPPRMTSTQRNAIASPSSGLLVFNQTQNRLSIYGNSTWRDTAYVESIIGASVSTSYTTATTGTDLASLSLTIVAGQTGIVRVGFKGGNFFQTVASNTYMMGISTTSGVQSYTLWDWGLVSKNDAISNSNPVCFEWYKTGLTPGTSYTIYAKFGRVASSTVNVYSGGGVGETGLLVMFACPV